MRTTGAPESVPVVTGGPTAIFVLIAEYAVLLGGAVLVARRSGPGGVSRLFSGLTRWRVGWLNWAVVLAAIPAATIAVAMITGTYSAPSDGWVRVAAEYLFRTFAIGALLINLAEEAAWKGLLQRSLARRHVAKPSFATGVPRSPRSLVGGPSPRVQR